MSLDSDGNEGTVAPSELVDDAPRRGAARRRRVACAMAAAVAVGAAVVSASTQPQHRPTHARIVASAHVPAANEQSTEPPMTDPTSATSSTTVAATTSAATPSTTAAPSTTSPSTDPPPTVAPTTDPTTTPPPTDATTTTTAPCTQLCNPLAPSSVLGEGNFGRAVADGAVVCWGDNEWNDLGGGTSAGESTTPISVPGVSGAVAVGTGSAHACAIVTGGDLWCWGGDFSGELGDQPALPGPVTSPPVLAAAHNVVSVTGGSDHTCAVISDGHVECWGDNFYGQLGDGTTTSSATPVTVVGVDHATFVSADGDHTCALDDAGAVYCWGDDHVAPSTTAFKIGGVVGAVSIDVGESDACAVLADTQVRCWGANDEGQLGDGTTVTSEASVVVAGVHGIAVAAAYAHSCAVVVGGDVQCWGRNDTGQLGEPAPSNSRRAIPVQHLHDVVAVEGNVNSTCAVLQSGGLRCWGWNNGGMLGDGTNNNADDPVTVVGFA